MKHIGNSLHGNTARRTGGAATAWRLAVGLAVAMGWAVPAVGLDRSGGPDGANHVKAQKPPHSATGAGTRIGIIEREGGININDNLYGRGKPAWDFDGCKPGDQPAQQTGMTGFEHATLVADVAAGKHPTHPGVAPGADVYMADIQDPESIRAAIDWMFREDTDLNTPAWKRHEPIALFNMSLGNTFLDLADAQPQNPCAFTLDAAGTWAHITQFPFSFPAPLTHNVHSVWVGIRVTDGDTAVGDFDHDNLVLEIAASPYDTSPLELTAFNDLPNNQTATTWTRADLTPADQRALKAKLEGNSGLLSARIMRIDNRLDADGGAGNIFTFRPVDAKMQLMRHNDNGAERQLPLFLDWHMRTFDTLVVNSAGNDGVKSRQIGEPGDCYNGITVGGTDDHFSARADYSSYWLDGDDGKAVDIRCKPDILAPSEKISDGLREKSGTSFAAPHVTGVAAMLMEKGLPLAESAYRNHLAIKAIILNSARKRHIHEPEKGPVVASDYGGTADEASDYDYLDGTDLRIGGTGGPAPHHAHTAEWTPSWWAYDGTFFETSKPLDDEQGTGLLDAERALIQFDAGEQWGDVSPIGWHRDRASSPGAGRRYYFDFAVTKGTFVTATLCWDRVVNEIDGGHYLRVDPDDKYEFAELPMLTLCLHYGEGVHSMVAISNSVDDNLQHLHIPFPTDGAPRDYWLEVRCDYATEMVPHGLAWWTVPEPAGVCLLASAVPILLRRRRRTARRFGGQGSGDNTYLVSVR